MTTKSRATIEDLYDVPENGKAEIVNGELVRIMPTGMMPSRASSRVWRSLDDYEQAHGGGFAINDEDVIKVYRHADPEFPTIYRRGDTAEAEPAVPGWKMPVDDLFR